MLISNIKSFADLNAKKNLQKQLLEVEANNELENQRRMQDFKNPYIPKPVPQQEKTSSELRKDRQFNEQEARKNLESFNMNYQDTSAVIIWLDNNNRLIDFNANFKGIKKDIEQNYNPKLVSPQWFENYLERYFEEVDVNYGRKMESGLKELPLASNIEELRKILPDKFQIDGIIGDLNNIYTEANNMNDEEVANLADDAIKLINIYEDMLLTKDLEDIITTQLNQKERNTFIKRYITILDKMNYLSANQILEFKETLEKAIFDRKSLINLLKTLIRQLSYITNEKETTKLIDVYKRLANDLKNTPIPEINKENLESKINKIEQSNTILFGEEEAKKKSDILRSKVFFIEKLKKQPITEDNKEFVIEYIKEEKKNIKKEIGENKYNELTNHVNKYFEELKISTESENLRKKKIIDIIERVFKINSKDAELEFFSSEDLKELLKILVLEEYEQSIINNEKGLGEIYDPINNASYNQDRNKKKGTKFTHGFGLKEDMHKHFVEDEKMLKKVAKELSDSESDEEAEKELMRHIKATKGIDKKIEKKLGQGGQYLPKKDRDAIYSGLKKIGLGSGKVDKNTFNFLGKADSWHNAFSGVGFKATKIKVGKGIAYEQLDNPTYREFGKYRIHIPNLVEKNIANFKYPSLAVIQSIKPLLITDDYKEFLIDVLKNGNINERHYKSLQPDERKHFERVSSGAGLIHKFKLTLNNEEEDIKDADRFNVLRGEYLAGNNNENMIKELRKLIVKFLNNGRISKNEGMNLLMELSI